MRKQKTKSNGPGKPRSMVGPDPRMALTAADMPQTMSQKRRNQIATLGGWIYDLTEPDRRLRL